jgi:hypothetical protein
MTKLSALCFATYALLSTSAFAKCAASSTTLFACNTAKNKQIEVCDAGKTISYTFGSRNSKPDIALSVPRKQATTYQWNGVSTHLVYSVSITNTNGNTIYTVFHNVERPLGESPDRKLQIDAGVQVMTDGKYLATVQCSGKNIISNIDGVDLAPTPE